MNPGKQVLHMRNMILGGVLMVGMGALASLPFAWGQAATAPGVAVPGVQVAPAGTRALAKHVVIISIDGCRPDLLLRAETPFIHGLLERASYTFFAETTDVAITTPSHVSMLTGVHPEKHGIALNTDPPDGVYPNVPTILEIAKERGMTTGVFSTKSKFSIFTSPGTVDHVGISKVGSSADDQGIARDAAEVIRKHKPNVMLVHFGNTDKQGHDYGWGSRRQMAALAGADASVAMVFAALRDAAIEEETLVIISSDHGGSGRTHGQRLENGEPDMRSRYIPWIAVGPGIRKGFDLTNDRRLKVSTVDTFATACYFLGLGAAGPLDGKPIYQVLANPPVTTRRATLPPTRRGASTRAATQAAAPADQDD
jgi:hypothetical protein